MNNKESFDKKWKNAKYLWKVGELEISKIVNDFNRKTYDDMYYRKKYFFTLTEAKHWIKKCFYLRTPDGHPNNYPELKEFTILKDL